MFNDENKAFLIARLHVVATGEDREIGIELNVFLRKGTKIKVFRQENPQRSWRMKK